MIERAVELGIALPERDIRREPQHRVELVDARGRATVPVLRITREGRADEWMPESEDIVRFLEERMGVPRAAGAMHRWMRWMRWASWGLLAFGAFVPEPGRSLVWALACGVASVRAVWFATRSPSGRDRVIHGSVGAVLGVGAVANLLAFFGVAVWAWWNLAFVLVALLFVGTLWERRFA